MRKIIGDKLGSYLDNISNYYKYYNTYWRFRKETNIKLYKWYKYSIECITNRYYEEYGYMPSANDVVIDIGSQFADYSLIWAINYNARVYAFEPLPINNYIASINKYLNKKGYNNLFLIPKAIGLNTTVKGVIKGKMLVNPNVIKSNNTNEVSYPTYPINEFIEKYSIKDIFMIKIDVEGFEIDVLFELIDVLNKFKPKLIIETHSVEIYNNVISFLIDFTDCNYILTKDLGIAYGIHILFFTNEEKR